MSKRHLQIDRKLRKKALEQSKKHAQALLNKMSAGLRALSETLAKPQSLQLPQHVRLTGSTSLEQLQDTEKRCLSVVQNPAQEMSLPTLQELTVTLGHARRIDSLITGIYGGAA